MRIENCGHPLASLIQATDRNFYGSPLTRRQPALSQVPLAGPHPQPVWIAVDAGFRFYFSPARIGGLTSTFSMPTAKQSSGFPSVEVVANFGLKPKPVAEAQKLIEEHLDEIRGARTKHFPGGSH